MEFHFAMRFVIFGLAGIIAGCIVTILTYSLLFNTLPIAVSARIPAECISLCVGSFIAGSVQTTGHRAYSNWSVLSLSYSVYFALGVFSVFRSGALPAGSLGSLIARVFSQCIVTVTCCCLASFLGGKLILKYRT